MKARHWWTVVGTVIVIVCGFIGQGLFQIACLSILLAINTADYIETDIRYNRHIERHPFSKDYMAGVEEGMRICGWKSLGKITEMPKILPWEKGESDE